MVLSDKSIPLVNVNITMLKKGKIKMYKIPSAA